MVRLPYERTGKLLKELFAAYGFSPEDSAVITDCLLAADLAGVESHGIQRMIRYDEAIKCKMVDVSAEPETVFETLLSAVIDARRAMGQLVSCRAMRTAIGKAKASGVGMVTVRNSNHFGIAGYYARMAAREDLIGVAMTNSEAIMVPTNARKAMLGTNPIAVAVPADPVPFVFDAGTTVVTRGKLEVYRKAGKPLPEGWALDAQGFAASSAQKVIEDIARKDGGGILPLGGAEELTGGHKGYGFGVVCELFTSLLAGGPPSWKSYVEPGTADTSHCFWAIDYRLFGDKKSIRAACSEMLEELRATPKSDGKSRVYIHGEKELEAQAQVRALGIPANEKTVGELEAIAASLNVPFSLPAV